MTDKSVVLVSYYGHQARLFSPMAEALASNYRVKHLRVYPLTLERVTTSLFPRNGLDSEQAENITRYYRLKKTLSRPELDTEAWRERLALRAAQWYQVFQRKLRDHDLLVVWNGFAIPLGSAVAAARSLGLKTLFCENGVLPRTLAMDPRGINCMNSLTGRPAEFYEHVSLDPAKVRELFDMSLHQRPLRRAKRDAQADCDDDKPLPKRHVLFAMQVHDDTQVLLFSRRFGSMWDAVTYVWDRVKAYNKLTGDNLQLVVKEHPSDFGRVDYSDLRAAIPGAVFLRSRPLSELLPDTQAVITLNSGVGVEALLYSKPVITLADAFYNVPGMVHHLGPDDDLAETLGRALSSPPDKELITKFLYFLRYSYLVPVSRQTSDPAEFEPAVMRVADILYDKLAWAREPLSG